MVDPRKVSLRPKAFEPVSGSIERQLGEVVATLRAFHEDLGEVRQSIQALDTLQRDSALDRRTQQQIVMSRIETLERTTSDQHRANTQVLSDLRTELITLKEPVGQWVDVRKRAASILLVATGVCSVLWTLSEPIYRFLVEKLLGH